MSIRPSTLLHASPRGTLRGWRLAATVAAALLVAPAVLPGAFPRGASLLADETTSPIDAVEDRALREESRAKYEEALKSFQEAFGMAIQDAASATGAAAGRSRARAEAYLEKMDNLSDHLSRHRETEAFLRSFEGKDLGPNLKGWVDWHRSSYMRKAGDVKASRELIETLGFVTQWWIVGPFDNERGRGFGEKRGPEGENSIEVDLTAQYPGKERKVAWRTVPALHPYGWIDFDAMLRPNDQALAFAVTWLHADAPTPVALRFGSDEGIVVWVNGTEMLRRDVQRRGGFDQDAIGVELQAGWNRILVKVGEEVGSWGFRMRATTPEGEPLPDLRTPATDAETAAAVESPVGRAPAVKVDAARGAQDALAEAAALGATAAEGTEDARAYFWLGLLHRSRQYDDMKKEQTDRKLLERAAALRPDDAVYRFHAAEAASRPIEASVEREENVQRRGREKALELDPGYAEAYYALANYYTHSLPNLPRAESMARRALEINAGFYDARLLLVDILRRRGYQVEAELSLRELLADTSFHGNTRHLRALAAQGDGAGLMAAARDAYKRSLEVDHEDGASRNALAQILMKEGLSEDAVGVFRERITLNPFDLDAYLRQARFLEGLGRLPEAAAAAAEGLAVAPESDALLEIHGRILHRMGRKEESLALWRESLRVNPKDAVLKRYVEWLDPSARAFELDYIEDASALLAGFAGREKNNPENDPSMVCLDRTVVKVNPDGTYSTFRQRVVKILNNLGVKMNTSYSAGNFWEDDQHFEWRTARVWRADGTVEEAKVQSGAPWVRWPKLAPGDSIEVQHRVDQLRQTYFGDYFGTSHTFSDRVPVARTEYILITPTSREFSLHAKNMPDAMKDPAVKVSEDGTLRTYSWKMQDLAKVRMEPLMPSFEEHQPTISVSTYKSWDEFSMWWWNLIRKQFTIDDEMKAKVKELVANATTREEKVRAIYNFVVTDIQYEAWPFGVHGYKPFTATAIYHRKWGDCKDKAILIRSLLGEIGIEAYPVLISAEQTRGAEDLTLPLIGHFNHCIAYVPDVDGNGKSMFMDGTAQYNSMDNVPTMDRGARVLIVRPEGGEVTTIPWNRPEEYGLSQGWDVTLAADGSASVKGTLDFVGDLSVMARGQFSVEGKRKEQLSEMLTPAFGAGEITEMRFPDLKDITSPRVSIGLDFAAKSMASASGTRMEMPVKFVDFLFGGLAPLASIEKREHDLVFVNPIGFETRATVTPPEGWSVTKVPDARSLETPFAKFTVEARIEDGKAVFLRHASLTRNRITREEYAKFRELVTTVNNASSEKIVLETTTPAEGGK